MEESNKRVKYIDIAKGIAVICIILGHLGNDSINRVVFTFHVPIFFFITGYFISQNKPVKEFILGKFRTLIVPYIFTCLLIICLGTVEGFIKGKATTAFKTWVFASLYGAGDSYTQPFYIPAIGALWFLLATFWGCIFLRVSLSFNRYVRVVYIIILFLLGYYSKSICWFPFSIQAGACATLFMYLGWVVRGVKKYLVNMPQVIKYIGILLAIMIWHLFIRNFQSFWLVHCDVGGGLIDIIGCICACYIVLCISKLIENKTKFISYFLEFYGKTSILVLCVHIIELNLFPWWGLARELVQFGMPDSCQLLFVIISKIVIDLTCVYILSRIDFVRKLYVIKL